MLVRALQGLVLATTLSACAGMGADPRRTPQAWFAPLVPTDAPTADAMASGRQAARSIWGVVPVPPRRKADLRPEMIAGSAIAVATDALLANCAVVAERATVGLVRHKKYRIARVEADRQGAVCRLVVEQGPLTPVAGWRSFGDLRVGEPVVALASRSSAEVAAAPGWLAGKGRADDAFLEATTDVPAGNRSAVLVDGFGNLIGLGAAAPLPGGVMLAVPVAGWATAEVANRDLGADALLAAALSPNPRTRPVEPPVLLALGSDGRDGTDRPPAARRTQTGVDEAAATATPRTAPQPGGAGDDAGDGGTGTGGAGAGDGNAGTPPGSEPAGGGGQAPDPGTGNDDGATTGGGGGAGTVGDDSRGRQGRGRGGRAGEDDDDDRSGRGRGREDRDRGRSGEDGGRGRGDHD